MQAAPSSGTAAARLTGPQRFSLTGLKCFVTGGSKGIGKAVVEELTALGAQVCTCARNQEDLDACIRDLGQAGLQVKGFVSDVTDAQQRLALKQQVSDLFEGQLHVLVCNVGTNTQLPTLQYTEEDYRRIMGTNLDATYALVAAFQPLLAAAGSSSCVLVSSVAGGPLAGRSGSLYAASKAALNQLAKSWACEWAGAGVRVNAVAPWVTLTELGQQNLKDPVLVERLLSRTPLKRLAQPEDVSGLVAFLCSPAASYITGQTIAIDGGYSVMGFW